MYDMILYTGARQNKFGSTSKLVQFGLFWVRSDIIIQTAVRLAYSPIW